jgi:hypothetical protein
MAKITIDQLSKNELLGLIYNNFNVQIHHICFCASCGKGYEEAQSEEALTNSPSLMYCCDSCNKLT